MNQEKYEEIAEKEIEKDRFLTELVGVETLIGIGIVVAVSELQYLLNIPEGFILYLIILLIGFLIWQMFRLEEEERELEKSLEN